MYKQPWQPPPAIFLHPQSRSIHSDSTRLTDIFSYYLRRLWRWSSMELACCTAATTTAGDIAQGPARRQTINFIIYLGAQKSGAIRMPKLLLRCAGAFGLCLTYLLAHSLT